MWKKLCGALLTLTMLLMLLPCRAEAVQLSAAAAILMDADSGEILFEKDAGRRMRIASTTKIMTALVALERANLTDTITVTADHMVEGSSMYLKPGETVTVEELLYGLMLCSGNDAALALADCCGGLDAFVQAMNDKAAALGMKDTSFANRYADVFHCEPIEKTAYDFIKICNIPVGTYNNVKKARYEVPDYWVIGEVYERLIEDISEDNTEAIIDSLISVYNSWISDAISNYNTDFYYQSREYIHQCYADGKICA